MDVGADGVDGLTFWRGRIVAVIVRGFAWLGLLAYVPSMALAFVARVWPIAVLDTLVYGWILALAVRKSTSDRSRAVQLIAICYLLGTALTIALGPHGAGLLWLGGSSTLTAVLLGTRAAVVALAVNVVVLVLGGITTALGLAQWTEMLPSPIGLWTVLAVNSLLVDAVVALSVAALLEGLETSIARERAVAAQLRQAQKLEAIGTLAGGIAHELNNMLAPIVADAEALRTGLPGDAVGQRELGRIAAAAARARDLVRRILVFGRRDRIERRPLDAGKAIREAAELLRATVPPRVQLRVDVQTEGVGIVAGDSELQQIVMNLGSNAIQAMPQGGTMTIGAGVIEGGRLALTVEDTGCGMDPATLEHAFEPFFTTKPPGEGTGLGLSTVHGIATTLGGRVELTSAQGQGTRVSVELPTTASGATTTTTVSDSADAVAGPLARGLQVLLVDDDPDVLAAHGLMLERLGCRVARERSAEAALAQLVQAAIPDVLVTDLAMPGMGGIELVVEARRVAPRLPIVLATGFLDERDEARVAELAGVLVVLKPFSARELATTLQRLLADAAAR